ncbi:hypothetical protein BST61_g10253 [Cercospora zeina]
MAPQTRTQSLQTSDNLGDPIQSKALQRRLKSRAKQQRLEEQQQQQLRKTHTHDTSSTKMTSTRRRRPKVPIGIIPTLSGKQKLLQHRANLSRGRSGGLGWASVKQDMEKEKKKQKKKDMEKMGRRSLVVA